MRRGILIILVEMFSRMAKIKKWYYSPPYLICVPAVPCKTENME